MCSPTIKEEEEQSKIRRDQVAEGQDCNPIMGGEACGGGGGGEQVYPLGPPLGLLKTEGEKKRPCPVLKAAIVVGGDNHGKTKRPCQGWIALRCHTHMSKETYICGNRPTLL